MRCYKWSIGKKYIFDVNVENKFFQIGVFCVLKKGYFGSENGK